GVADRDDSISPADRAERADALQAFIDSLIGSSIPAHMRHLSGDYAVDGTTKWAHSKPRFPSMEHPSGNHDGATTAIVDLLSDDQTLAEAGFASTDRPETTTRALSPHDTDARFLGRKGNKAVFGF